MRSDGVARMVEVEVPSGGSGYDDGAIRLSARPTGHKELRGTVEMRVWNVGEGATVSMSPDRARKFADILLDLAAKAENFSTRGFVGSDE